MAFTYKPKVIIDFDDVLAECNSYALRLLSKEEGRHYSIEEVTDWGPIGKPIDGRLKYYSQKTFFESQPAMDGAKWLLKELMKRAEVVIATAVNPLFMGERITRISNLFPDFPLDHVLIGTRKDMIHADIMIDDGLHNLLASDCTLPVLFDQPWNRSVSGICRVRGYDEIITLVDFMAGNKHELNRIPKVVCLVGPSGSDKHDLADALCENPDFEQVKTVTTSMSRKNHIKMDTDEFNRALRNGCFLEHTYYTGDQYGIRKSDIDDVLRVGRNAVLVMDISGCMSAYNAYPGQCKIFYVDKDKRDCVMSILSKKGLSRNQICDRIMSIDYEQKNKVLADCIINGNVEIREQAEAVKENI